MSDVKLKGLSEVMKPFNGEGDVISWIKKAKLVAKLKNIDDLASFLPLYLEGDALLLYLEMSEADQKVGGKIESRLKEAFTDGEFTAYGKLGRAKWAGEQVDVFANEIRRLASLSGFDGVGLERTVKLNFVNGFPEDISMKLQQLPDIKTISMSDLIQKARIYATRLVPEVAVVAVRGAGSGGRQDGARRVEPGLGLGRGSARTFRGKCFRCNGAHMMKDCKEPKPPLTCFKCGERGHISLYCDQGNEQRGTTVPVATPATE